MPRVRGISFDRDYVKRHFEQLLDDGRPEPISYTRFVNYVGDRCRDAKHPVSKSTLKALWTGQPVDPSTLKAIRDGTGVDLQRSPEEDRISLCIGRLAEVDQLMEGRIFAPAKATAGIDSILDDLVADLRWILPHQHALSLGHQQLICRLAGQAMGSLQMLRRNPDEQLLLDLQAFGMAFAGFVSAYSEPLADQARGWICYNWIGKNWNHWCHPQQLLSTSALDFWTRKLREAESYFRRASNDRDSIEAQTLRITSYRNLILSEQHNAKEMSRLRSEIGKSLRKSDQLSEAYLLVLDSHRCAKSGDLITAIARLSEAKQLYIDRLGPSHHFVTECDLRLVQLGHRVPHIIDVWELMKASKISCSCIVDLHEVDNQILASKKNDALFVRGLRSLQGKYDVLK